MRLKVHRKRPDSRLTLHYDKLHVDNAIYVYNEETDSIELLNVAEIQAEYENQVKSLKNILFLEMLLLFHKGKIFYFSRRQS